MLPASLILKFLPYVRPLWRGWALAIGALVSVHVFEVVVPLCLKLGVNRVAAGNHHLLAPVAAILALTTVRYGVLHYGRRRNAFVSTEVAFGLRRAIYAHILKQSPGFFARFPLGDLLARATNDIEAVRLFLRTGVFRLTSVVALLIIAPLAMLVQSPLLTTLTFLSLTLLIAVSWRLGELIRAQSALVQRGFAALTQQVQQKLEAVRTIQAHGQEDREIREFAGVAHDYAGALNRLGSLNGWITATIAGGSAATTLAIIGAGGWLVQTHAISVGTLSAFIFYLAMIMWVVKDTAQPVFLLLRGAAGAARIFEILEVAPDVADVPDRAMPAVQGQLTLRDVYFAFPDGTKALHGINLTIHPGERVAILGGIGAGKSALLRLLGRQYDPALGDIALDGLDLQAMPLARLRGALTIVLQDSFLFAGPLGENISYDQPDRAEEAIWRVAEVAALAASIRGFPEGLATLVGERGITLSGGQRQRTSLARGVIRETPLLLLDDCFSALDAETEALILDRLWRFRGTQGTIFVTHRVSSARHADKIVIMERGRIAECGSHDDLLALNGVYARLVRLQSGETVREAAE